MSSWLDRLPLRPAHARHILRLPLAAVFASHGLTRIFMDRVAPFGEAFDSWGFPLGALWAWGITGFEVVAAGLLLLGRAVRLVSLLLAVEISFGICLVHWHHGWFVVGHGGNGMEYSVVLISALVALFTLERHGPRPTTA